MTFQITFELREKTPGAVPTVTTKKTATEALELVLRLEMNGETVTHIARVGHEVGRDELRALARSESG